ncbi:MAG: ABC transporter permease [Myxococcaceae bacterium]|nr:ABC transporter permease [Myxococcaceae bacterium]
MFRYFQIAARNLWQHRLRTSLVGLAVALVTAVFVLLTGISNGTQNTMITASTTLLTGHINVAGFYKVTPGQGAPVVTEAKKVRAIIEKEVPEVESIVERGRGWARLVSDSSSLQVGLAGIDIETEKGFDGVLQIESGDLSKMKETDAVLLFQKQAEKLGYKENGKKVPVKVGDRLTISAPTPRGTNNTLDVTVVAIAKDMGLMSQFSIFMNNTGLRRLYQMNDDTTGALQIQVKHFNPNDRTGLTALRERIGKVLQQHNYTLLDNNKPVPFWMKFQDITRESWTGQRIDLTLWSDEASFLENFAKIISVLFGMVIFTLVVIVSIGIFAVMWVAVRERTREIGTLRAIGMQRFSVMTMFQVEGVILGVIGALAGAVMGLAIAGLLNAAHIKIAEGMQLFLFSDHLILLPTANLVAWGVGIITVVIGLASIVPSVIASLKKPVEAMSHSG